MEILAIDKNIVTYREAQYTLNGYEVIDSACLHLFLDHGIYAITLPCTINTQVITTVEQFEQIIK